MTALVPPLAKVWAQACEWEVLNYTRLGDLDDIVETPQGRPLSEHDDLRVVDEDGNDVPPGEEGELLVRGPYTGTSTRRRRTSGRSARRNPAIWSAAAMPLPDEYLGEKICPAVVFSGRPITLAEVNRHLDDRGIVAYAMPDVLEPMTALPTTAFRQGGQEGDRQAGRDVTVQTCVASASSLPARRDGIVENVVFASCLPLLDCRVRSAEPTNVALHFRRGASPVG